MEIKVKKEIPWYVFREVISGKTIYYEIGEQNSSRKDDSWCSRRVCEGFWGNRYMAERVVRLLNNTKNVNEIPRRNQMDLYTPAELAIYRAIEEVERAGADIRLTDASIKLQEAQSLVADFVDSKIPNEFFIVQKSMEHETK
jgi:hypothetical protein